MNATKTRVIGRKAVLAAMGLVISFALLGTLVAAQTRILKSRRALIHLLMRDDVHGAQISTQPAGQAPQASAHAGLSQPAALPAVQSPSAQAPAVKAKPQISVKPGEKSRKAGRPLFIRPPAELIDPLDMRRATMSI